jgi:hypothetical protein
LVVGGGAGITYDLYVGDDLALLSDAAVLNLGADKDVTITHDIDDGIELKSAATADDNPFLLTLQTGEADIAASDVLGTINFQAPDEGTDTDSRLVAAGIEAVSEGDFSSSNNATKLSFKTAASEAAAEKMKLSSTGVLTLNGGSGALVIPDGGTIGAASATTAMTVASNGIVTFVDDIKIKDGGTIGSASTAGALTIASGGVVTLSATTASSSSTTGALVVGGGVGVAADLYVGGDLTISSSSKGINTTSGSNVAYDESGGTTLTANNYRRGKYTLTTHNTIADDTHSAAFTVQNNTATADDIVIMNCTSNHSIEVHTYNVSSSGWNFFIVNRTGGTIAADTDLVYNYLVMQ